MAPTRGARLDPRATRVAERHADSPRPESPGGLGTALAVP
jgi:hypothetical protein